MNIIKFSWGETFAVDQNFDLNHLKQLFKVKESSSHGYLPVDNTITIELGKRVEFNPAAAEKINIAEIIENRDYYQKQYWDEQKKGENLKKDLDCIKTQLDELLHKGQEPDDI